jgi:hypothetical protein
LPQVIDDGGKEEGKFAISLTLRVKSGKLKFAEGGI